jgi:predicted  nucleic acid-binding Zn-ribbon protein
LEPPLARVAGAPETPGKATAELLELQGEIETLDKAVQARDAEIGAVKDLLESTRAKGDELVTLVEAQTARLDAVFETLPLTKRNLERLTELAARQASIEGQLAELPTETALQRLGSNVTTLEGQLARMPTNADQDALHEELGQLRAITEELPGRIKGFEGAVTSLAANVTAIEQELTAIRGDVDALRDDTERTRVVRSGGEQIGRLSEDVAVLREETIEMREQLRAEVTQRQPTLLAVVAVASVLAALAAVVIVWAARNRYLSARLESRKPQAAGPPEAAREDAAVAGAKPAPHGEIAGVSTTAPAMNGATALRSEIDQLKTTLERDRKQAGSLERHLGQLGANLERDRKEAIRLKQDLASVREGAVMIGKGLVDPLAMRVALQEDLDQLRAEIESERERYRAVEKRSSEAQALSRAFSGEAEHDKVVEVADQETIVETDGEAIFEVAPEPGAPRIEKRPEIGDAVRERAIAGLYGQDIQTFETCLSELTSLPVDQIRSMARGSDGKELAIACRAVQIDEAHFVAAFMLSRTNESGQDRLDPLELSRGMELYEKITEAEAKKTLAAWQSTHTNSPLY